MFHHKKLKAVAAVEQAQAQPAPGEPRSPPASLYTASQSTKKPKKLWTKRRVIRYSTFLLGLVFSYIAYVLFQRLFTWDFLVPLHQTAARVALPTAVISLITFMLVFFDATELQKRARRWLSAKIEKTNMPFVLFCVSVLITGAAVLATWHITPLRWAHFIDHVFLASSLGDYTETASVAERLKTDYPNEGAVLAEVISIFKMYVPLHLYRGLDLPPEPSEEADMKLLDAALSRRKTGALHVDAFLLYGLAHADMLSDGLNSHKLPVQVAWKVNRVREMCIGNFREFLDMPKRAKTLTWEEFARQSLAQQLCIKDDYEGALRVYLEMKRSPVSDSGVAQAYCKLGRYEEAIQTADRGLAGDYSLYSGGDIFNIEPDLAETKMIAQLSLNRFEDALATFQAHSNQNSVAWEGVQKCRLVAFLLAGKVADFNSAIEASKAISSDDRFLFIGLMKLWNGDRQAAMKQFRELDLAKRESVDSNEQKKVLSDNELLGIALSEVTNRWWLSIPSVQELIRTNSPKTP